MKLLALNAFHGGSHRAFLKGWIQHSRHEFTLLTLPAQNWKWRMRHAAVTFAEQVDALIKQGETWDGLFCTDMLNLAEFFGLCPTAIRDLPAVLYFHENQLTYPNRAAEERDLHFAFTNFTSARAAAQVWFNSAFHRDEFLSALTDWFKRMPADLRGEESSRLIRDKSAIHPPGIEPFSFLTDRNDGPLRILWVARWEHDKDPETFFSALKILKQQGCAFRLHVLGESYAQSPACFAGARELFADEIDHWGYLKSRDEYRRVLASSDVVVSTALHEFFGIAVVEAVAAGCIPLVPNRLAYPEVFGEMQSVFHDGTVADLAIRLTELSRRIRSDETLLTARLSGQRAMSRFGWKQVAAEMDATLENL